MLLPQKENWIVAELEKLIFSGKLKKGDKIPSEYELAARYGVSKLTANKAVARLAERGLCVRLGGRGGTVVAGLAAGVRGKIIYLLTLLSGGLYCAKLLRGASRYASSHGYALQYYEIGNLTTDYWDEIIRLHPAGVLFTSAFLPPSGTDFPIIAAGSSYFDSSVSSDDYDGGKSVAELFIARGHRRVAVLSDSCESSTLRRIDGFFETWKKHFPEADTEKMYISTVTDYNPETVWLKLQSAVPGLTGVFCYSDTVAFRLLLYLQKLGIRCPEDFSICGYGFMPLIQQTVPLTSVNQYPEEIGHTACEKLIGMIEEKNSASVQLLTPVELVNINATVGAANVTGAFLS